MSPLEKTCERSERNLREHHREKFVARKKRNADEAGGKKLAVHENSADGCSAGGLSYNAGLLQGAANSEIGFSQGEN
jgi:hypothetical protein